jgi:large subunit ribosomal protein L25
VAVAFQAAPSAEALEAELAEAEAEAGIEREEHVEAAAGAGEGDVVPEPLDQGSGESMESAEKSADNG